jgi:hypothetical protein
VELKIMNLRPGISSNLVWEVVILSIIKFKRILICLKSSILLIFHTKILGPNVSISLRP